MGNIKRLNIETIFADCFPYEEIREEVDNNRYGPRIDPIIGKPGCYRDGKKYWVELDGKFAFIYNDTMLDYYLDRMNKDEHPLRDVEFKAIDSLYKSNPSLLPSKLVSLYFLYLEKTERLENRLNVFKMIKDCK